MQIHYRTSRYAPPRRVSLRLGLAVPAVELAGFFRDGCWTFSVPEDVAGGEDRFVLVLDGMVVSRPYELAASRDIPQESPGFVEPDIGVDSSRLQRALFGRGAEPGAWDVVVVGTGMGGGTLLAQLALLRPDLKVLGLEAGPMLLPTHVGNLPRRRWGPSADGTSLWGLYPTFGARPFETQTTAGQPLDWGGYEVFGLGGRSLFWGGLCPRISSQDGQAWPAAVVKDLATTYYERAETLLNVGHPQVSELEHRVRDLLDSLPVTQGRHNVEAPLAQQREEPTSWRVASGLFSTADLILAERLRVPDGGDAGAENWPPFVHLSELVTGLERDGDLWTVRSVDLTDGSRGRHTAARVVLAAGTVESARIALSSPALAPTGAQPQPGSGLTEHPMWYLHFEVPAGSPFHGQGSSAKMLSTPGEDSEDSWNLQVELNYDLNEARSMPLGLDRPVTAVDPGTEAGQLVFLGSVGLRDQQRVEVVDDGRWPELNLDAADALRAVRLQMDAPAPAPDGLQAVADAVVQALQARARPGGDLRLRPASLGYVAHEVGTLRMGEPGSSVVDEHLRWRGQQGLYVCDNSVFPAGPAANPSLTLCALALRLADTIAADHPAR